MAEMTPAREDLADVRELWDRPCNLPDAAFDAIVALMLKRESAAVQAEREACATVADACANQNRNGEIKAARRGDNIGHDVLQACRHEAEAIAAAIRARGEQET